MPLLPAFLCAPPRRARDARRRACAPRCEVPTDARAAARQIRTAVRTALVSGRRHINVDILVAAIDSRSRTFDTKAAGIIFHSLVSSLQPAVTNIRPLHVVVSGATAALRVSEWQTEHELKDVRVCVLGVRDGNEEMAGGVVMLDPPGAGDAISDVRRTLAEANRNDIPVLVLNHPRRDDLYRTLGFGGSGIPRELMSYETVFALAPFSLTVESSDTEAGVAPQRFVLMRQFPERWELWRYQGYQDVSFLALTSQSVDGEEHIYHLCAHFQDRPSDKLLMQTVAQSLQ